MGSSQPTVQHTRDANGVCAHLCHRGQTQNGVEGVAGAEIDDTKDDGHSRSEQNGVDWKGQALIDVSDPA